MRSNSATDRPPGPAIARAIALALGLVLGPGVGPWPVRTVQAQPQTAQPSPVAPAATTAPAAATAAALDWVAATVEMSLRQVSPRTWYVVGQSGMVTTENQGFNSNAGFVVTPEGVVVFDALGTPGLGRRLRELIATITPLPIRHVVVSHYHADHVYGLQGLADADVPIWADVASKDYLASAAPQARLDERRESLKPWVDARTRILPPTQWVEGEARFTLGDQTFRLLSAGPAHSSEDLMMVVEPEGVLFVGDLMFTGRIPFVADADVSAWIKAIDRVLTSKPRFVIGGHGPASDDALADLSLTRDYLIFLRDQMTAAFDQGLDFEEAYGEVDWSRFSSLPAFNVANRRNAYQTWLNVEREALSGASAKPR